MSVPAILEFEGVEICILDRMGRPWITQTDLTRALYGLKGTNTSVGALAGDEIDSRTLKGGGHDGPSLKAAGNAPASPVQRGKAITLRWGGAAPISAMARHRRGPLGRFNENERAGEA